MTDQAELTALAAAVLHLPEDPERALEIGCGGGDGALFLAREFPRAAIRGCDRSEAAVRAATARIGLDPEARVAFKKAERGPLPFPDANFDLVVEGASLPNVAEAARLLRPGGHLIFFSAGRPGGFRRRLGARRLTTHGFEALAEGGAGGGSFSVVRLAGTGRESSPD